MHPHKVVVLIISLLAAVTMILTGGALSASALPAKRTDLYLNEAQAFQKNPYVFLEQFVKDADAAPAKSTIRIATFLWDTTRATDALVRAHKRGVYIRMVVDPTQNSKQIQQLRKLLGSDRTKTSFLYQPTGSGLHHSQWANIHAKVITFSKTGMDEKVSYIGSGNLAVTNLRDSSNEQQRYANNPVLYEGNWRYIEAIVKNKEQKHYYKSQYGRVKSGSVTLAYYPGAPDLIYNAVKYYDSPKRCKGVRMDVAIFQISDADASVNKAKAFLRAAKNGCDVNFIYNYKPSRILIGTKPAKYLFAKRTSGPLKGRYWIDLKNGRTDKQYIHNKELLIKTPKSTKVFAGSGNWLGRNRFQNADVISINTDPTVYATYFKQWGYLWNHGVAPAFPKYDSWVTGQSNNDPEPEYDSDN